MSETTYTLKVPFSYAAKDGEVREAEFITIQPPSYKQAHLVGPITQAFMAAVSEVSKDEVAQAHAKEPQAQSDSVEIDGAQVMQLLYNWSGDMAKVLLHAGELFKQITLVDGEVETTKALLDKMDMKDFNGLVGAYVANFIAPSLMDGT